jgi:hypothetical protein
MSIDLGAPLSDDSKHRKYCQAPKPLNSNKTKEIESAKEFHPIH